MITKRQKTKTLVAVLETQSSDDLMELERTVKSVAPGRFDVFPANEFDPSQHPNAVIVACGKDAAERLLGRGNVKISKEAGHVRTTESGAKVLLQFSPGYVRHQTEKRGGSAEKAVRLWLDVWEQAAKMCEEDVGTPPTVYPLDYPGAIKLLTRLSREDGPLGYDYETWGDTDALRPELNRQFKIVSIGVSVWDGTDIKAYSFLFDRPKWADKSLETLWLAVLRRRALHAHFIRYEHKCNLKRFGFTVPGRDTLLQLHALDELADGSLDRVMLRCGMHWGSFKTKYEATRKDPMNANVQELLTYNGLDAYATLGCGGQLEEELEREGLSHVARQDEQFSYYLAHQEMAGMHVDTSMVLEQQHRMGEEAVKSMAELRKSPAVQNVERWAKENIKSYRKKDAIFNPKSTPMMHQLVLKELKIKPIIKKKQGKESVSLGADDLEKIAGAHPVLMKINSYRSAKSMEVYLSKWSNFIGPNGSVHSNYSQTIVVTGRLSSTNPPLQNIPKEHEIRRVFTSRFENGWLINADYAQQEPRLIAGWSGDLKLIRALNSGLDLHAFVAAEIYGIKYEEVGKESKERDVGKRMNLGIAYGQTEYGLSAKTGLSIDAAADIIRRYDQQFPDVTTWRMGFHRQAMKFGYVEDLFGARRHLADARSDDKWVRERALRQAGNYPVQGTAYRFTQIAAGVLTELYAEHLPGRAFVVGQVHDSIVSDVAPGCEKTALELVREAMLIHNEMEWWKDKGCPMGVDLKIGRNLFDMEKVA